MEEDEAPNGGLFSLAEVSVLLSHQTRETPDWTEDREWFYPLTLFDRFSSEVSWEISVVAEYFYRARFRFSFDLLMRFINSRRVLD